jgi:hypothetical protein
MKKELKQNIFRTTIAGFLLFLPLLGFVGAIEVSPSKPHGGGTNSIPNSNPGAPSLFKNPFKWVFGSSRSEAMVRVSAPPNLHMELTTEPRTFLPSTNATLKVQLIAINKGKDKYILEFNSAQHYDFIISTVTGKEIYRASKDKVYTQQLSSIVLNRKEKIVYEETLFSPTNKVLNLKPGEYKLKGVITAKTPISVETMFMVNP